MTLSKKYTNYLIGGLMLGAGLLLLHLIGEIILPFVFAIFCAYLLNPLILKIQKKVRSRNLAITSFLLVLTLFLLGIIVFFGGHISKDTKRLVRAVEIFAHDNEQQIKDIKKNVVGFVDDVYGSEIVQSQIERVDTLKDEEKEKDLMTALESVYSFFENPDTKTDEPERKPWNWFYMLIYTILYTVTILYTYDYFEKKYAKYFGNVKPTNNNLQGIWKDFEVVFLNYFRQRAKVVIISISIFILAFSLMDLPGAIIIGIITGVLTYAAHFHYLSLPIAGIGCWVLSIERDASFFLFFGILIGVYILVSVLEETVFFNKIMKSVNGMNPAIMFLSFVLWIYIFGGFTGTVIALPLTQLIMICVGRIVLYSKKPSQKRKFI